MGGEGAGGRGGKGQGAGGKGQGAGGKGQGAWGKGQGVGGVKTMGLNVWVGGLMRDTP